MEREICVIKAGLSYDYKRCKADGVTTTNKKYVNVNSKPISSNKSSYN